MDVSSSGLSRLLQTHIVELTFARRNNKRGWPPHRRMLCTLSPKLLNSLAGRMTLNFTPPTNPPPYDARDYELVVAWDILWQDWRAIPTETVYVISAIPVRTKKEIDEFWAYFDQSIMPMSSPDKKKFMRA